MQRTHALPTFLGAWLFLLLGSGAAQVATVSKSYPVVSEKTSKTAFADFFIAHLFSLGASKVESKTSGSPGLKDCRKPAGFDFCVLVGEKSSSAGWIEIVKVYRIQTNSLDYQVTENVAEANLKSVAGEVATRVIAGTAGAALSRLGQQVAANKPAMPEPQKPVERAPGASAAASTANMEFVRIPAGEFQMGCSPGDTGCDADEKPAHRVRITKAFEIGKYEVTQAQWEAAMGTNPSYFKGSDRPVEQVSWDDAQEFLKRLNARQDGYRYRLPTEAEWEYAARAGQTGAPPNLDAVAWHSGNSGGQSHPVGQKQPNAWGLYDMLGNVWEWCQDWYEENYYQSSPAQDPQGPSSGQSRLMRGGSWNDGAWFSRVAGRNRVSPAYRGVGDGFRCVRERN